MSYSWYVLAETERPMNALTDAKIRFSDAIKAVEITSKTLRGWMANDDFSVFSRTAPKAWLAFTAADLAVLAIMRPLVMHGVGIGHANAIARDVLTSRLGPLIHSKNMPAHVIESVMIGHRLIVWRETADWVFTILYDDEAEPEAPAYVVVDLAEVVGAAISRALGDGGE
jgi:hypothetical protein